MKTIRYDNKMMYGIYQSDYIVEHLEEIRESCEQAVERINNLINTGEEQTDVTWFYQRYNIFSVRTGDIHFYNIFKELVEAISTYFKDMQVEDDGQVWMQSWLNHHKQNEVLGKHDHASPVHGYICLDPKTTKTVFYDNTVESNVLYELKNVPGQIYIGPGKRDHAVINTDDYDGYRLTMGFDIDDDFTYNLGLIPIILDRK